MKVQGYQHFGGKHPDSAAVRNLLAFSGVVDPGSGKPFTEAAVLGIAGGIGAGYSFCPSVPRYGIGGGVTVVARNLAYTFDGTFHKTVFGRLGVPTKITESSSPKAAQAKLAKEIGRGKPVLVWCANLLSYFGADRSPWPGAHSGRSVVVHGIDEGRGEAQVADLAPTSLSVPLENLAQARGRICTHKNRALTIEPRKVPAAAARKAMLDGIRSCVEAQKKPRMKTFSLQGLEEWGNVIANGKNAKGWLRLFPGGRMAWPLKEVFQTIETEGTGGGLMRPMFADFLEEAAEATGKNALRECAPTYRALGERWTAFAEAALPNRVEAFRRTKDLLRTRARLFEQEGTRGLEEMWRADGELKRLETEALVRFPLGADETAALLEDLRGKLGALCVAERGAIEALGRAVA